MDKIKEMTNVTAIVKDILVLDAKARDSDNYLYHKVIERLGVQAEQVSVATYLTNMSEWGCPPFESVRRARQKVQAKHPELSASKRVNKYRTENERDVKAYAVSDIC